MLPAPVIKVSGVFPEPGLIKNRLADCDILCCLSQNAAKQFYYYQGQLPKEKEIWTIGAKTKTVMQHYFKGIHSPEDETSEGLYQALKRQIRPGVKFGLLKGVGGRDYLHRTLSQAGAIINPINLYRRETDQKALQKVSELLAFQQPSVMMVGSGELLRAILSVLPGTAKHWPLIVPGTRVADLSKSLGFEHVVEAKGASGKAFYNALRQL